MKLYFENRMTKNIQDAVKNLVDANAESNGNISLEYIPDEELECYEDSQKFIGKHTGCDFYLAVQCVCGAWDQPLTMVAVEY